MAEYLDNPDMFSEIVVTIDTREKKQSRIKAITNYFEERGGIVELQKLDLCDYEICGIFREKEINLGIECKSMVDFMNSYKDLPDKLARSFELYDHVALFVVEGTYQIKEDIDGYNCTLINPALEGDKGNTLKLAVYESALESWTREGIIIRRLRSELQWPYSMKNLMAYLVKDTYGGLYLADKSDESIMFNMLMCIPGVGIKQAKKLYHDFGNLYWICHMAEDHILDCLGPKRGKKIYDFLHSKDLNDKAKYIRGQEKGKKKDSGDIK